MSIPSLIGITTVAITLGIAIALLSSLFNDDIKAWLNVSKKRKRWAYTALLVFALIDGVVYYKWSTSDSLGSRSDASSSSVTTLGTTAPIADSSTPTAPSNTTSTSPLGSLAATPTDGTATPDLSTHPYPEHTTLGADVIAVAPYTPLDANSDAVIDYDTRGALDQIGMAVAGSGSVPSAVAAVQLSVTVAAASGSGYVTIYPCGSAVPLASSLNYSPGQTYSTSRTTAPSVNGSVCLLVSARARVSVSVTGYVPDGSTWHYRSPARFLETRLGQSTIDGRYEGLGIRPLNDTTTVDVTGRDFVPDGAVAVVLDLTVTETESDGYVSVFDCAVDPPQDPTLVYGTNVTVSKEVEVNLAASGKVCIFNTARTQVLFDVKAYSS